MMNGVVLTEGTGSALDQAIEMVPKVVDLGIQCFNAMINQPVLLFFFAVGLVGTGLGVFRMFKNTAKGSLHLVARGAEFLFLKGVTL